MKYNNKEEIKETAIKLYLEGKTLIEIAKLTGCSRNYLSNLIKDDDRVKDYRTKKTVQLYKCKNQCRINVPISTEFWSKIGISNDINLKDLVDITVNENNGTITIKKH